MARKQYIGPTGYSKYKITGEVIQRISFNNTWDDHDLRKGRDFKGGNHIQGTNLIFALDTEKKQEKYKSE